jgi:predicted transcriptional regulator
MKDGFIRAEEVARELDVSKAYAYKLIQKLNGELKQKNFITIAGRVSRKYFQERIYGTKADKGRGE